VRLITTAHKTFHSHAQSRVTGYARVELLQPTMPPTNRTAHNLIANSIRMRRHRYLSWRHITGDVIKGHFRFSYYELIRKVNKDNHFLLLLLLLLLFHLLINLICLLFEEAWLADEFSYIVMMWHVHVIVIQTVCTHNVHHTCNWYILLHRPLLKKLFRTIY
jgi:hypothetical protein